MTKERERPTKTRDFYDQKEKLAFVRAADTFPKQDCGARNYAKEKSVQQTRPIRRGRQSWAEMRKSGSEALFG